MRKLAMVFAGLILMFSVTQAQKITGLVNDEKGKGMEKTTVSLLRAKDSSVVKLSVTNKDGAFSLQGATGNHLVSISHVGYAMQYSKPFEVSGDVEIPVMQMVKATGNLQ